jgi:putative nodulation protein
MPQWTGLAASRFAEARLDGTLGNDTVTGTANDDAINGGGGDDIVYGGAGEDRIKGSAGFDVLFGEDNDDTLFGGTQSDFVYGGRGTDVLFGDSGYRTAKGSDLAADRLDGGDGRDTLVQGDGNDVMTGGAGRDSFEFRFNDPLTGLAAGTGPAFTSITDFDAGDDRLTFDAAGVGFDRSEGVNFLDGGAGDGATGGAAATFFSGAAADSAGEAVVILTETGFASGVDAVAAAQGEAEGDLIVYFNTTVDVASLLYVTGTDTARSVARFTDITSVEDLASEGFTASDFVFI